jgi:hypothetical protein
MPNLHNSDLEMRLNRLHQQLKLFQTISLLAVAVITVGLYIALRPQHHSDQSNAVLRLRGLIIEDEKGRDRILIGAPVPKVVGRRRQDDATGLLILNEDGVDRLAVAAPTPNPQMNGHISERIGNAAGLMLDDSDGNERGGFGVLDNDRRVVLGLDYPKGSGEALTLSVLPDEGPSLQIRDTQSYVRAAISEHDDSAPKLYGINFRDKTTLDVGIMRLSPYALKHVTIEANDKALTKALNSMNP